MTGSTGSAEPARSSVAARALRVAGVGVVIVLALVTILTALRTELPRSPGVMSDALGPDPGEPVTDYLDRAAASLAVGGDGGGAGEGTGENHDNDDDTVSTQDPDASRWALVSAAQAWTVAEAEAVARDLPRVSGMIVQVPVEGVAMPVTTVILAEPVAGEVSRAEVFDRSLARLTDGRGGAPSEPGGGESVGPAPGARSTGTDSGRAAATAQLTSARIGAGEPAVIALLVRGRPAQLRAVAEQPGVRAVEALPEDAVWGRFAVRPLLPQQIDTASPLPDSAPVPAR